MADCNVNPTMRLNKGFLDRPEYVFNRHCRSVLVGNFGTPMPSLGMIFRAESSCDGLVAENLATTTEIEHRIFECPQVGRPVGHFR